MSQVFKIFLIIGVVTAASLLLLHPMTSGPQTELGSPTLTSDPLISFNTSDAAYVAPAANYCPLAICQSYYDYAAQQAKITQAINELDCSNNRQGQCIDAIQALSLCTAAHPYVAGGPPPYSECMPELHAQQACFKAHQGEQDQCSARSLQVTLNLAPYGSHLQGGQSANDAMFTQCKLAILKHKIDSGLRSRNERSAYYSGIRTMTPSELKAFIESLPLYAGNQGSPEAQAAVASKMAGLVTAGMGIINIYSAGAANLTAAQEAQCLAQQGTGFPIGPIYTKCTRAAQAANRAAFAARPDQCIPSPAPAGPTCYALAYKNAHKSTSVGYLDHQAERLSAYNSCNGTNISSSAEIQAVCTSLCKP